MEGLWHGTVVGVDYARAPAAALITIPRLSTGLYEVEAPEGLAAGDRILVGLIEGRSGQPAIIRRLG